MITTQSIKNTLAGRINHSIPKVSLNKKVKVPFPVNLLNKLSKFKFHFSKAYRGKDGAKEVTGYLDDLIHQTNRNSLEDTLDDVLAVLHETEIELDEMGEREDAPFDQQDKQDLVRTRRMVQSALGTLKNLGIAIL